MLFTGAGVVVCVGCVDGASGGEDLAGVGSIGSVFGTGGGLSSGYFPFSTSISQSAYRKEDD